VAKIEAFRQTLTRAEPDVLVMVGSDHFHQLWLTTFRSSWWARRVLDANWYNEERGVRPAADASGGDEELAAYLLR